MRTTFRSEDYVRIRKASDLKIGETVTVIYSTMGVKPFEHCIRNQVIELKKDGRPTQDSETVEQYQEYKDWLRRRFRNGELYRYQPGGDPSAVNDKGNIHNQNKKR